MSEMKAVRRNYGFTLIETLIAVSLCAMLMVAVAVVIFALIGGLRDNDGLARSRQSAVTSMNYMVNKVRRSVHIEVTSSTLKTIDAGTYNSDTHIWTPTSWTLFSYDNSVTPPKMTTTQSNSTGSAVLNNVTNLTFTGTTTGGDLKNPNHYVTIAMTVTAPTTFDSRVTAKSLSFSLSTTALVRASLQ